MSIDFNAAFAEANWPTAEQIQQCFVAERLPLALINVPEGPFALDQSGAIYADFRGRRVTLETEIARVDVENVYGSTYEGEPELDVTDENGIRITMSSVSDEPIPLRINDDLRKLGAKGIEFGEGDFVLTVFAPVSDRNAQRAAMIFVGGMVKCFNGYGFEFQTNSHGGPEFGQALIRYALKGG